MSQFVAHNLKITVLKGGADFASDDDPILTVNGKLAPFQGFSPSPSVPTPTGVSRQFFADQNSPNFFELDGGFAFTNSATFRTFDRDVLGTEQFGNTGLFETAPDDPVSQTTYVAGGREPLLGQGSFHFTNIGSGSGSTYQLDYDINKLPGSTTGKLASAKGGFLNGSNKDGTLVGQGGKDIINANDGDDLVVGNGNDDTLNGGKGADLIFGGKGYDQLSGGQGFDTFVLAHKNGFDTVKDFRVSSDQIGLGDGLTFEDLSLVQQAKGTLVKAGGEQLGFLQGTKANQLSATDFTQIDMASFNSLVRSNVAQLG